MVGARDEERTAVVLAALLPPEVGGGRERLWQTLFGAVRVVDLRAPGFLLVHDARVLELLNERLFPPITPSTSLPERYVKNNALVGGVTHMKRLLARIHVPRGVKHKH